MIVDGPDGVGKTTAVAGLVERIQEKQILVKAFHFPTKHSPIGKLIREKLSTGGGSSPSCFHDAAMLHLLVADALDEHFKHINPFLKEGGVVICDRHPLTTSYVYQGSAWWSSVVHRVFRNIVPRALRSGGDDPFTLVPDTTLLFVLLASPQATKDRMQGRGNLSSFDKDEDLLERTHRHYALYSSRLEEAGAVDKVAYVNTERNNPDETVNEMLLVLEKRGWLS